MHSGEEIEGEISVSCFTWWCIVLFMYWCEVHGETWGLVWICWVGYVVEWPCCLGRATCGRVFLFDCFEVLLSSGVGLDDMLLGR